MLAKPKTPLTRSPLRRRQGREGEVAAVDEPVAVEQHQAFGGHDSECTRPRARTRRTASPECTRVGRARRVARSARRGRQRDAERRALQRSRQSEAEDRQRRGDARIAETPTRHPHRRSSDAASGPAVVALVGRLAGRRAWSGRGRRDRWARTWRRARATPTPRRRTRSRRAERGRRGRRVGRRRRPRPPRRRCAAAGRRRRSSVLGGPRGGRRRPRRRVAPLPARAAPTARS